MPLSRRMIKLGLMFACVSGLCLPQTAVRWATSAELVDINKAVHRLVSAANKRDAQGVRLTTTPIFNAAGAGWEFGRDGMAPWSALKAEGLGAVELAVMMRHAQMLSEEVAVAEGYFRTSGLLGGDLSGDVTASLLKREGVWLVSTARFAPIRSSSAISTGENCERSYRTWA